MSAVRATIEYLRACQRARRAGHPVSFTTDPKWLVNTAINRRAGWVEYRHDRAHAELNHRGEFPRRATLEARGHLRLIVDRVNTPRVVVRVSELGEWRRYLLRRIPGRFTYPGEES